MYPSALDPITSDIEALKSGIANTAQAADVGQLRSDVDALRSDWQTFLQSSEIDRSRSTIDGLKGVPRECTAGC